MRKANDYDSPWKEALSKYFPAFLELCFPEIHAAVDWSRGYELLDQELRQVIRAAKSPKGRVDLLVRVWRPGGEEAWLLIHVEVQAQAEAGLPERTWRYHYRLYDRYRRPLVTVVVLADDQPSWRPNQFGYELCGCEVLLRFPTVKLLDFDDAALAASLNPIAAVVRAHLRAQATRRSPSRRLRSKIELVKQLYQSGLTREDILELLRLVDWLLNLPDKLDERFWNELETWEKETRMPYVTSWERLGERRGELKALREAILENLTMDHGDVPEELAIRIRAITNQTRLRVLQRASVRAESLDAFRRLLEA